LAIDIGGLENAGALIVKDDAAAHSDRAGALRLYREFLAFRDCKWINRDGIGAICAPQGNGPRGLTQGFSSLDPV